MTKTVISRRGSQVVVRDSLGKLWLTRRKKLRHDSRRRKNTRACRVIHLPIRRILEKGDWLFTCKMEPVQFDRTIPVDRSQYPNLSDSEWDIFKDDMFCTLEGSHHSRKYCSCTPISDEYAQFFIQHKLWELFRNNWEKYEADVRTICNLFKIKYEGI